MVFFERMKARLRPDIPFPALLREIITPFMPYTFCDHYYGKEVGLLEYDARMKLGIHATNLLANPRTTLRPYDIIHCEFRFLKQFVENYLPTIQTKFILTTGSYHIFNTYDTPQYAERILAHPQLHMWFSQNPMIETADPRYRVLGYGMDVVPLYEYTKALLKPDIPKQDSVQHFYVSVKTNPCRRQLPPREKLPPAEFYDQLKGAKFVLSPIGDRNDCYRHWESIGLGAIPICNTEYPKYKDVFGNSMIYSTIPEMNALLENNTLTYVPPNRDLICVEYWKQKVLSCRPARTETIRVPAFNGRFRLRSLNV